MAVPRAAHHSHSSSPLTTNFYPSTRIPSTLTILTMALTFRRVRLRRLKNNHTKKGKKRNNFLSREYFRCFLVQFWSPCFYAARLAAYDRNMISNVFRGLLGKNQVNRPHCASLRHCIGQNKRRNNVVEVQNAPVASQKMSGRISPSSIDAFRVFCFYTSSSVLDNSCVNIPNLSSERVHSFFFKSETHRTRHGFWA